jgi:tripartite-type tricarboxylate transporter receptor subunit TctC
MGPRVPDAVYIQWVNALNAAMEHPAANHGLAVVGLERHWVTGPALERLVQQQIEAYRALASEFGVIRP